MFLLVPSYFSDVVRKGKDPGPQYSRRKMFQVTIQIVVRSQKSLRPTTCFEKQSN